MTGITLKCRTRKWGNSIGVVLPKEAIEKEDIGIDEEVVITVKKKKTPLEELFGAGKDNPIGREVLEEVRKHESKWF